MLYFNNCLIIVDDKDIDILVLIYNVIVEEYNTIIQWRQAVILINKHVHLTKYININGH